MLKNVVRPLFSVQLLHKFRSVLCELSPKLLVLTGCLDPEGIPREVRGSFCPRSFETQLGCGRDLVPPLVLYYFSLTRDSSTNVKTASVWSPPRV